mmetsp:Transcript_10792/g.16170  ORF Transcript_10792/g.16170 Transcript_10792/m.16170 type:complete len:534 (+) Transcript_10792:3-1604(+)
MSSNHRHHHHHHHRHKDDEPPSTKPMSDDDLGSSSPRTVSDDDLQLSTNSSGSDLASSSSTGSLQDQRFNEESTRHRWMQLKARKAAARKTYKKRHHHRRHQSIGAVPPQQVPSDDKQKGKPVPPTVTTLATSSSSSSDDLPSSLPVGAQKRSLVTDWSPSDLIKKKERKSKTGVVTINDINFADAFQSMERKYPSGEYHVKQKLGKGRYGTVKLAHHHPSGEPVAIKFVHKYLVTDPGDLKRLVRESRIQIGLKHENVIQLYDVIETEQDILLVMEYAEGGDLFHMICDAPDCRLELSLALRIFRQCLSAIDYCHSHYVIHRDLKPENIMLDKYLNVKIGDFGFSRTFQPYKPMATSCGSLNYAAPEIVSGSEYTGGEVDVWSLGVIYYALVCGDLPFSGTSDVETAHFIKHAQFRPHPIFKQSIHQKTMFKPQTNHFLKQLFQVNPKKRMPMPEIRRHPCVWLDKLFLATVLYPFAKKLYPKQKMKSTAIKRMEQAAKKPQPAASAASSSSSSSSNSSRRNNRQVTHSNEL